MNDGDQALIKRQFRMAGDLLETGIRALQKANAAILDATKVLREAEAILEAEELKQVKSLQRVDPELSPSLLMQRHEVRKLLGLKQATIGRLARDGQFPRPRRIGRVTFWLRAEVIAWAEERPFTPWGAAVSIK
jgi:predicted DNA-binding transcriptional regulator AlpA